MDQLTADLGQLALTGAVGRPGASKKKRLGQFFTSNASYILDGFTIPWATIPVIEPCAGAGDLIHWLTQRGHTGPVEAYDIDPKPLPLTPTVQVTQRDTIGNPPTYANSWVLANPPYSARNHSADKTLFDQYGVNDHFKCFIKTLTLPTCTCLGGALIIPAAFFLSPREMDRVCRDEFMSRYSIQRVNYFEERVFNDTSVTVVAIQFARSTTGLLTEQQVPWVRYPTRDTHTFTTRAAQGWIIGGEIYDLPISSTIKIGREVTGKPLKAGEVLTRMFLRALDSGEQAGRIALVLQPADFNYPSVATSRTYAMLTVTGTTLTVEQQQQLCDRFNALVEAKRADTWSLFLPQYRESKEYARKRMPFELAYRIVVHLILHPPTLP